MRILHINTYQTGGAALCMQRLGKALYKQGVECRFLLMNGDDNNYTSIATGDTNIWSRYSLLRLFQKAAYLIGIKPKYIKLKLQLNKALLEKEERIYPTLPLSYYRTITTHPWVKDADIIHIHWIGNFVDFPTFFKNIKKPIVWTIHDLNPLLGCFHYKDNYKTASQSLCKIEKECLKIKHKALSNRKNINIVAISEQMFKAIKTNQTLSKYPTTIINNGVDTEKFIPYDRKATREELNIGTDMIVFMFSAYTLEDRHKGLKELICALETTKLKNIVLLCIGNYLDIPKTSFPIQCVGYVSEEALLSKYYSTANYFVMPSYQEGFAQTPLEAMSCGTPVIAFPCSGTEDLINENNGIICKDFTIQALIEGIICAINKQFSSSTIRKDIINRFTYSNISKQYINLYNTIVRDSNVSETIDAFSNLNNDIIKQQRAEHKQQLELFSHLDEQRDFYKMLITHPRYIAGWIKRKIQNLFN